MRKKYVSDTLNFGIGGDRMEKAFWRAIDLLKMLYLEDAITLCGTNNIKKDS